MCIFKNYRVTTLVALCALAFNSQAMDAVSSLDATQAEAATYSELYRTDEAEAITRLKLQQDAGRLEAELINLDDGFAGLWIEHEPVFQVVARFVNPEQGQRMLAQRQQDSLSAAIEVRPANFSLAELQEQQILLRQLSQQYKLTMDSEIDIINNQVTVYALNPDVITTAMDEAAVRLPTSVVIQQTSALAEPEMLQGGSSVTSCTAGFTVRNNGTNEQGISTAAHCPNGQSFAGTALPFRREDQQGNQDVQWNSSCGLLPVTNQFNSGIGVRNVTGTLHRNNQVVGSMVCKFGRTTGRTCGNIGSKSFAPNYVNSASSTFIRVDATANFPDLSAGGDSGGPWYLEQIAYGTHSGGFNGGSNDGDSIYMAINYISSIGVSVLTANPGACDTNLRPIANFTWTNPSGTRIDFDASSSSDPDGNIVNYAWDFGDGVTTVTTSPTTTHFYNNEGLYSVELSIVDNDGATAVRNDAVSTCFPMIFCTDDGGFGGF